MAGLFYWHECVEITSNYKEKRTTSTEFTLNIMLSNYSLLYNIHGHGKG
jgi:hypothetical protein